ncbi:MAG: glycoside hydrolase family 32 protein [Lachnospiraceae bacterium]|nr:glycoside hydrolase family 32 protein [Lachnospiraceae bacterium]
MEKKTLEQARTYEAEKGAKIPASERPVFHLTPRVGWTNDPNGFSFYDGKYHLFYQYNPYDTRWDSMHWGHAVSTDLVKWEYLPAALAPDREYDSFGCFSGSALELPDGRHLLLYTGVRKAEDGKEYQTQCVAVGDGLEYRKYEKNPVLTAADLPEGLSPVDFRDPKAFLDADGRYRCVVGGKNEKGLGELLLFESPDGFDWHFQSVLMANDGRYGCMWECPDFFFLGETAVLLTSPQDMEARGLDYHSGNGTLCQLGSFDREKGVFVRGAAQTIDHGIDFYAPQTTLTPDGRRVMIAWMQNWDTCDTAGFPHRPWFGQMTVPRELSLKDGKLIQVPVRELESHRRNRVEYRQVEVAGPLTLPKVEGRCLDLILKVRPGDPAACYHRFEMIFAKDGDHSSRLVYYPGENVLETDRSNSGSRRAALSQRRCHVRDLGGEIELRIVLDRFSAEVFVNGGEQAMTTVILTDPSAALISFDCDGKAVMDLVKYDLFTEE